MRTALLITAFIVISIVIAFTIRTDVVEPPNIIKGKFLQGNKDGNKGELKLDIVDHWNVPDELKEISALTYLEKDRFACIQDELGKIFIYNTNQKNIEKEISFGEPGDYEGLAIAGNNAYVLRADGTIFEVKNFIGANPKTVEHKTSLTEKHDTEGLCYDQKNNRLLITIKGKETSTTDYKGIYSFNLKTYKFSDAPVYKIDLKNEIFSDLKAKKPGDEMQPAAIAIHPTSGDIYITEAAKPKLLILDKTGAIKKLEKLKSSDFPQPEGISFSPEGRLFISNEGGKKEPGNITEVTTQ